MMSYQTKKTKTCVLHYFLQLTAEQVRHYCRFALGVSFVLVWVRKTSPYLGYAAEGTKSTIIDVLISHLGGNISNCSV